MLDSKGPPEPWRSFFDDLDSRLNEPVDLHCFGGFVVVHAYGVSRTTNDIDFVSVVPNIRQVLVELAGQGSALHRQHKVYLDGVTVSSPPEAYEDRLEPLFLGVWPNLRLFALEAHDLALAKLERNLERDRDDVLRLARAGHIQKDILADRYDKELRPYLGKEEWNNATLRLWIEMCWPEREGS